MKIVLKSIIAVFIEGIFFYKSSSESYELLFMVFGFIFLTMLLFNMFHVKSDSDVAGLPGGSQNSMLSLLLIEKMRQKNVRGKRNGGIYDSENLFYLALVIINVIGYVVVMPK